MAEELDITPTPRILKTLGDIPFDIWQCFAELTDNSLDMFQKALSDGVSIEKPRIDIHWSTESAAASDREIIIKDNGLGMDLETLQKAAKAGYTSNDPIHHLGLFGMGFNVATARLGDETLFLSATKDSPNWVGIKIDFDELIKKQSFSTPVVNYPKSEPEECGTKVIIRKLKNEIFSELKRRSISTRRRLESVYAPILEKKDVEIHVQGKQLSAMSRCIWSESRYVIRKGSKVNAIQRIDRDLGEAYFDLSKNRYLSEDEGIELESKDDKIPEHIIKRSRRLKGWIGIQRYADPSDFGIDFVRNGRKIIVADKTIFSLENPETGTLKPEYPVELGSTTGGRIVGEVYVDYLVPTYQKNSFDTTDKAWRLTIDAIRGAGPILPRSRANLNYDGDNESPLGKLVNAYRRLDPGTKNLAIPNALAKEYAKEFSKGNSEYQNDEKWFRAAQEADRERSERLTSTPPNIGDTPSDDTGKYAPTESTDSAESTPSPATSNESSEAPSSITSERDQLISMSERIESLSGQYAYGKTPGMTVTAWRVRDSNIFVDQNQVPYILFKDGVDTEFFFDLQHPILNEYPFTPKQLLLLALANQFTIRDPNISLQQAYLGLIQNHLNDERINVQSLYERANTIFDVIKDKLPNLLSHRLNKAMEIISNVPAEEEELCVKLLDEAPEIFHAYQNKKSDALHALSYVSSATVIRLIQSMPEDFLDGKLFDFHYENIKLSDPDTNDRLKKASLEKIIAYVKDASLVLLESKQLTKHELIRNANTLTILEDRMINS